MSKPRFNHKSSDTKCLMDDAAVREARRRFEAGGVTYQQLAAEYKVKDTYMKRVVNYESRTTVR